MDIWGFNGVYPPHSRHQSPEVVNLIFNSLSSSSSLSSSTTTNSSTFSTTTENYGPLNASYSKKSLFGGSLFSDNNDFIMDLQSRQEDLEMTHLKRSEDETEEEYRGIITTNGHAPAAATAAASFPSRRDSEVVNIDAQLLELSKDTKYPIVQRNGQRIYGGPPPGWEGPPPEKGSEVFVGKIPRNYSEVEFVPLFSQAGKIYELRLMMDFSGSNRGYLFVLFTNKEEAKNAIRMFNNYEIRPGQKIGVVKSVDNRKLWITGLHPSHTAESIRREIEKLTEGVRSVILYPCQKDKSKPRGYAFIEYENHRAAALARRKLVPGRVIIDGHEVEEVDWAEPENDVDEEIMSKVRVLFVRNLSPMTTEKKVAEIFEELSGSKLERVKISKDYAFVHFQTREDAETAMAKTEGLFIDGCPVEVIWSKPVDKNIYNTRKELTKAFSRPLGYGNNGLLTHNLLPGSGLRFPALIRGIAPRTRGAAGIRGLGAPGTSPPRSLIQKLTAAQQALNASNHRPSFQEQPENRITSIDYLNLLCEYYNWGKPIYQLVRTPSDEEDLYTYKVIIPHYPVQSPGNVFQSLSLKNSMEEAKFEAAQNVLTALQVNLKPIYPYEQVMAAAAVIQAQNPGGSFLQHQAAPGAGASLGSTLYSVPCGYGPQFLRFPAGVPYPPTPAMNAYIEQQMAANMYNLTLN